MIEEIVSSLKPKVAGTRISRVIPEDRLAHCYHSMQLLRLRADHRMNGSGGPLRIAATACWDFPIYSQTFVYQELVQAIRRGFQVRFLYTNLSPRSHLPPQFSDLWTAKRKMVAHPDVFRRDYEYFRRKCPDRIEQLVATVCERSGVPESEFRETYHFKQAFTFTRMVEAMRPHYIHSYFFYEGTLFALFASYLLDVPRGVSCYADHLLNDYKFKLVPLHLEQCRIVIATSHRIKRELIGIAPHVDAAKILVKPNAIDSNAFPIKDSAPDEEPYQLICVSRIEPKKGLIYLVSALRLLRDRRVNVHLHLVGTVDDNPAGRGYAAELETRIRDLHLEDVVHFQGRRTSQEIRGFFGRCHLFVAPFIETDSGDKDGIPTALLEAMAAGMPVVATDAGSITEVVEHEKDGILVNQRDPGSIAREIELLLADRARRQALGTQAAAKVRQHYDVSVCEGLFHERIRAVTAHSR